METACEHLSGQKGLRHRGEREMKRNECNKFARTKKENLEPLSEEKVEEGEVIYVDKAQRGTQEGGRGEKKAKLNQATHISLVH